MKIISKFVTNILTITKTVTIILLSIPKKTVKKEKIFLQADKMFRKRENCEAENILQETMQKDFKSGAKEFDSAHSALYDGEEGELCVRFVNLCKMLNTEILAIKSSLQAEEEQLKVIGEIVEAFVGGNVAYQPIHEFQKP